MNCSIVRAATRLGALALIVAAAPASFAQGANGRPFEAELTLSESIQFTGVAPCFGVAQLSATGNASQLGKVTATSSDCVNPIGVFNPAGPNSFSFASIGTGRDGLVFTAANGDAVYATYSGTVSARASGPHLVEGNFTIVGGTGRFAGATGGGTLTGSEDLSQVVSATGRIQAVGTIVY